MTAAEPVGEATERLRSLEGFLAHDPDNLQLLSNAAETARSAGQSERARALLDRYAKHAPLPPQLQNLLGLVALDQQRFDAAIALFTELHTAGDDPAIAVNLAWAKAMIHDDAGALALLESTVAAASPSAARLRLLLLHRLGRLEDALEAGRVALACFPDDAALLGAAAVSAMDAGDAALAQAYALRAGSDPDALAVLGMFDLDENRVETASQRFDAALAATPNSARAHLGKGLVRMVEGASADAVRHIDQAADLFSTHLGSWIAAGWAHFSAGDMAASRVRFERALSEDDRFAEAHGGLAVLNILDGRLEQGTRQMEVAFRLDRNCLSAALAKVLILQAEGRDAMAARVRDLALNRPIDSSGRTLAQAMVRLNVSGRGTRTLAAETV